jgi:hypothetical protein
VRALDGLAGIGMLDATQRRELGRLRERPRQARATTRRQAKAGAAGG